MPALGLVSSGVTAFIASSLLAEACRSQEMTVWRRGLGLLGTDTEKQAQLARCSKRPMKTSVSKERGQDR